MLVSAPGVWAALLLAWMMTFVVADPLGEMDDFTYNLAPRKVKHGSQENDDKLEHSQEKDDKDEKHDHSHEKDDKDDKPNNSQEKDDKPNHSQEKDDGDDEDDKQDNHHHHHHHHYYNYYGNDHQNDTDSSDYKKFSTCRKFMCGTLPSKFKRHMKECALEMDIVLPVTGVCPPNFEPRGNECFFVHEDQNEALNWNESRKRCKSMGGDLAQPQNMTDFVQYIKENYPNSKSTIWLGATDRKVEGEWKWVTGEAVPEDMWKPWPDNQPSGDGNCMEIHYWDRTDFYMNDWFCNEKGHYACEIEPIDHHHDHPHPYHVSECGRPFRPNHPSQNGTMALLSPYVAPALRKCILTKNGILNSWNSLVNRGVLMSMIYPSFLNLGYPELAGPIKEAIETTCPEPVEYEIHDFYRCVHKTCVDNIVL